MSAQDLTEQVLREIHIMLARCEIYDKEAGEIIVNKKELLEHLKRLNTCIEGLMDEYELTKQGRDAAERETRKKAEEIIQDATHKAEDVYAASVLYTDEALHRVQEIMQAATDSVKQVYENMNRKLQEEKRAVQTNQSELKGHLQNLADTDKYLKIIEERNRENQRQKEKEKKEHAPVGVTPVKPEIRINAEYFEKAGLAVEEEVPEEKMETVIPEINVNLDADYFRWKEEGEIEQEPENEKKSEKFSLFGKILRNDS